MNPNPIWLCLHFQQLPLEVFLRGISEEERSRPAVVLDRQRVMRLNQAAAGLGIETGNNMDTAYSLSDQIISFERNEEKEYAALAYLAQWAYQFTPNVSIKAPDCLLLDISGCLKLFNGLANLTAGIEQGLQGLGFAVVAGVHRTPLAATLCAHSRFTGDTLPDDVAQSLSGVPVRFLALDSEILESLLQMGITNLGQLLSLPAEGLTRRFGVYFRDHLARLTGEKPDPQKFVSPRPNFHSELTFLTDVSDLSALSFPVNRLAGELEQFLNARQLCTDQLTWKLSHRSHPARSFSVYLANPESDQKIFLPLTQLKLDNIDDVKEVDAISLSVSRFDAADRKPGDLFEGTRFQQKDGSISRSNDAARASQFLNILNARLGLNACYGLALGNDHRPEKATRTVRLGHRVASAPCPDTINNPRPLFLLTTPRELTEIEGQPMLGGKLELLKGPERIDSGWWDEPSIDQSVARDYYVARQQSGALLWVFNRAQPDTTQWYLHGIFS